ncbi:MAG TPA: response regulator transcription factor [Methylocystis sp.]|nr:response regulator transcription factor [Methylocystis sp.]
MPNAATSLARVDDALFAAGGFDGKRKSSRRPTVLCVEDDADTATLISEELDARGFDVVLAGNGREGWSLLLKSQPDVILCDINMPFMSGFELLEAVTAIAPRFARVPFIFLTALSARNDELKGRRLGADDFIAKPVDFDLLEEIIAARLRGVARMNVWPQKCNLNDREIEALMWAARGKTSEEIATIMSIVERTVNFHLNNAREKLGVATRIQAAVKAAIAGFIEP